MLPPMLSRWREQCKTQLFTGPSDAESQLFPHFGWVLGLVLFWSNSSFKLQLFSVVQDIWGWFGLVTLVLFWSNSNFKLQLFSVVQDSWGWFGLVILVLAEEIGPPQPLYPAPVALL